MAPHPPCSACGLRAAASRAAEEALAKWPRVLIAAVWTSGEPVWVVAARMV